VSDRVAILNHGRLLAEAPIATLLAGKKEASTYILTLRGEAETMMRAQRHVASQPWVSGLSVEWSAAQYVWEVNVTDVDRAEAQLLSLVLESGSISIMSFGRKTHNLEEVFLQIVEGSSSNVH
jgi:ABC-type multidrug transport system ATPase subunit